MRPDVVSLRTWWLAVFAGWAVLVCLLAGFGLGGRLPVVADVAAARPLPAIPAPAAQRLGDLDAYAAIAQRPVFAEDRRPHPFFIGGNEGEQAGGLRLTGVLLTPQLQMATLTSDQGRSLRLRLQGEAVDGWRLLSLAARSATVDGPGGTRTLELQVFDGHGGEPPTILRGAREDGGKSGPPVQDSVLRVPAPAPAAPNRVTPPTPAPPPQAVPAATPQDAATAPPAPSEAQLQAIRERIEARRRALQQQQNSQRNGDGAVPQKP